jgi:three-Cys-motif partner protein
MFGMKQSNIQPTDRLPLFPDLPPDETRRIRRYARQEPIWTENKAHFISKYLQYFVQITKHGAYIDGFAGPQSFNHLDAWSAALVLGSEPKWLRTFFLCELKKRGLKELRNLAQTQADSRDRKGKEIKRRIEVVAGDFNYTVADVLSSGRISQKEATFCLLDQRTFECHWATVERLAAYKRPPGNKIELLYFLGVGWLHRAFSGIRDEDKLLKWWGNSDWRSLEKMPRAGIAELVRSRFEKELGYQFAVAYPIFDREHGNKIMYYMIHASDHTEATGLMIRAHRKAVRALPSQLQNSFEDFLAPKAQQNPPDDQTIKRA